MYIDLLPTVAVGLAAVFSRIPRPLWLLLGLNLYLLLAFWNGAMQGAGTNWNVFVRVLRQPALWALGIAPAGDSRTPDGLSAVVSLTDARWDGDWLAIDVAASNSGSALWLADPGKGQVLLAIRTFGNARCQGESLGELRFAIFDNVAPGQTVHMAASISKAMLAAPHLDFLCAEMLAEGVAWFRDRGPSKMAVFKLDGETIRIPPEIFPAIPFGRILSLSSPEVEPLLGDGWSAPGAGLRSTVGPEAFLNFRTSPGRRLLLRVTARGIASGAVEFRVNGAVAGNFHWANGESKTIELAVRPDTAGNISVDLKVLHPPGLAVTSVQLVPAAAL